jgi:hypothetical protein
LICYRLGWSNALAPLWLPLYTRKVIQKDVEILRNQGENLRRFNGETRFHSTPADRSHEYIESLRELAEPGGDTPAPEPQSDEVEFWI